MPNPLLLNLFWDIKKLKGVGSRKAEAYARLGCKNIRDLIFHFPYQVIDRRYSPPLNELISGKVTTQVLSVIEQKFTKIKNKRLPQRIICLNSTGKLTLVYFNVSIEFLKSTFAIGSSIVVSGKAEYNNFELQMVHPDIITTPKDLHKIQVLEPVYPSTYGLNSRFLSYTINDAIKFLPNLPEWIPINILTRFGWSSWLDSIRQIHKPVNENIVLEDNKYKQRLAFDELLAQQLTLQIARKHHQRQSKMPLEITGTLTQKLISQLPFKLTQGQELAINEVTNDQKSHNCMARLLVGDVGCGKTIVALCAMLNAAEAKKQSVLMVPTEILARQHFQNLNKLCDKLGIKIQMVISKLPSTKKKEALKEIATGETNIIIGTHALFQESINFYNLSLVIIDEQHRFGVEQRLSLVQKALSPDFLMMSATPIPRTMCMINYGDLDLSMILDKPIGREPVHTSIMSDDKINTLETHIKNVIDAGDKVYWVCPLIEESESLNLSNVEKRYNILNELLPNQVGLIHSKIPTLEKDKIMSDFQAGKLKVLVATTVIEVGVDVSDATIMIIENAEKFGLSQLHQLRGRVGRSNKKSYCILIFKHPLSATSRDRLQIMKESSDGFRIAEEDLKIRGSGELLGTRQSGLPLFKTCNISHHYHLIPESNSLAKKIIEEDPDLKKPEHQNLKLLLELYEYEKNISYLTKN